MRLFGLLAMALAVLALLGAVPAAAIHAQAGVPAAAGHHACCPVGDPASPAIPCPHAVQLAVAALPCATAVPWFRLDERMSWPVRLAERAGRTIDPAVPPPRRRFIA